MSFFNLKEDVLDIELTPYGKHLLSKGKFKPTYYAFFDDDILYDSEYADVVENRGNIQTRIKETPRTKVQYVFHGLEEDIERNLELIRSGKEQIGSLTTQPTPEKHYALSAPLGNSSLSDVHSPAWKVKLLKGELTGAVSYKTGSFETLNIPQLTAKTVVYKTRVADETLENIDVSNRIESEDVSDINLSSPRFEDNTYIKIEDDFLLLDIREDNVDDLKRNFDIEVFIEETDGDGREVYTQLLFEKQKDLISENDILLDQEELKPEESEDLDSRFVEHFFHLYVDEEISRDLLCRLVPAPDKVSGFPAEFLDCEQPELEVIDPEGLYSTDVTDEDLEEDC